MTNEKLDPNRQWEANLDDRMGKAQPPSKEKVLNYNQPPRAGKMLVDSKCVELAEHFCHDNPEHKPHVAQLAEAIQQAVESFLSSVDYESDWMDEA